MPKSEEKIKVWWYLLHVAMENPSVSKKGFIILTNSRDSRISQHDSKWYLAACSSGDRDFPILWKMAHVCHANAVFPIVASAVKAILSPEQRESFILHSGSNERVLESLSEYSLSADCIPTHLGGTIQVSTDDFIRKRLAVEGGSLDIESDEVPSTTSQNMDIDAHEAWRDMTNMGTVIDRSIISSISPEAFYCISRNRNQLDAAARNYGCVANTKLTSQPIKADHFDSMVSAAANSNAINIVMAEEGNQHSHVQNIQVEAQQKQNSGGPFLRGETKQARGKKGETAKAHPGRLGDPRMNMAVAAKLNDPDLPLLDALLAGGFVFPDLHVPRVKVSTVKDTDNVTVYQRRNQLLRRLRVAKAKDKKKALQM